MNLCSLAAKRKKEEERKEKKENTLSHMDRPDGESPGRETANIREVRVPVEFMYGDKYGTLICAIMLAEARTQTHGISPCEGNTSILNKIGPTGLDLHYDAMINYTSTNIQLLNPFVFMTFLAPYWGQ